MVGGGNSRKKIDDIFEPPVLGQQSMYTSYIIYDQVHVSLMLYYMK